VNEKLTATIEPSARVLVKMPVATAYCSTVATTDFVLTARSQGMTQDLRILIDSRFKGTPISFEVVT